jgi:carbonic anhydrase/acetyltransferase-like protein (isoleucine patch superfamily)
VFVKTPTLKMNLMWYVGRSVRDCGLALDRLGCRLQGNQVFTAGLTRHRAVQHLNNPDQIPSLGNNTFVAQNAGVVGDVTIGSSSAVLYDAGGRGDVNSISIGSNSIVGENALVHVSGSNQKGGSPSPTKIGNGCEVGSGAIIHGATLRDNSRVEAGAVVFDKAVIQENAVVGAGSMVPMGTTIPSGELWKGTPAKFFKKLSPEEIEGNKKHMESLRSYAAEHAAGQAKATPEAYIEDDSDMYDTPKPAGYTS